MYDSDTMLSAGARIGDTAKQIAEPEIAAATSEAAQLGKMLAELRTNLSSFVERTLVGELPTAGENQAQTERPRRSLNGGSTGNLRREIELAGEIAEDALRLSNRLRQVG